MPDHWVVKGRFALSIAFLCVSIQALWASDRDRIIPSFALHDGDRIVFYGDNISEVQFYDNDQEPRLYTTYLETYGLTRFPSQRFTFIDSAWSGERVNGGLGGGIDLRLRRDVFAKQPTVLTIMLGMNDAEGKAYDSGLFRRYANGYRHIVDSAEQELAGIRITVIQPSAYDDITRAPDFPGGYNDVLIRYGDFVKRLGKLKHHTVADFNAPLIAVLQRAKRTNPAIAESIIPDRTHPGPGGQLIMAEALLKAWHAPPLVSSVSLDFSRRRFTRIENSSATKVRFESTISWTQLDKALPFPIDQTDPTVAIVLQCSDFVKALDQETFQAIGLPQLNYRLEIDGQVIGRFTRERLAEGINLALFDTPMERQALRVYDLTRERNDIYFGRWRQVQLTQGVAYKQPPGRDLLNAREDVTIGLDESRIAGPKRVALQALDRLEQELVALQRAAAQPQRHSYRLVPE